MKGLGWIVAIVIAIWFFFFRQGSGASTGSFSNIFGGTSGGIDTGGTASPSGNAIPLTTVNQGSLPIGTSGGFRLPPHPLPPVQFGSKTGTSVFGSQNPVPLFGGARTNTTIPAAPTTSVAIIRPYYLPAAVPTNPLVPTR